MAVITGAVMGGLALADNIYSQNQNADAAANAAKQSQNAANAALATSKANYQQANTNLSPYISTGDTALSQLAAVNNGDYSGFNQSPDYLYALQQGLQGVDRSAASRGALYSGGTSVDTLKAAEGLASQNLGNYRSSLTQQAQLGEGAASNLGSLGQGQAGQVGNIGVTNAGNQTTAGYNAAAGNINTANNTSSILGQLWGQYGNTLNPSTTAANSSSYMPNALTTPNYVGPGSLSTTANLPTYLGGTG